MYLSGKMIQGLWTDEVLRKNKLWVITSPMIWIRPNGQAIKIHPHLITDYASIPKFLWWLLPKRSEYYDIAAAFHDNCVRYHKALRMSISECHDVFKEIMKYYKTPKWKYTVMYQAVRLAGIFTRSDGYGRLPWKLTEEEIAQYKKIIEQYPWYDISKSNKQSDPTLNFCI